MEMTIVPHPGYLDIDPGIRNKINEPAIVRYHRQAPRTRHLNSDGRALYVNRLFFETSPYLNQHAHNPVNWFPWGEEAIGRSRSEDRPILLSIGYATCHWCHVMEEESFEDPEIARFINDHYVPVKVDREERPDVDSVYMKALHAMGLQGGWPLTVILTPGLKPFFGGTYFPPRDGDRGALMGFLSILERVSRAYERNHGEIVDTAEKITRYIQAFCTPEPAESLPGRSLLSILTDQAVRSYDPVNGGLKGAPKFPGSFPVSLLLRHHERTADPEALNMAVTTLEKMALSGMYDQVGGGFHRYAVDEQWRVPHFEKMLTDNALLAMDYIRAFQVTQDPFFGDVARDILDYVIRDMQSEAGGFFSATDADSRGPGGERREGYYFTWTPDEMDAVLGRTLSEPVKKIWNVTARGNFEGRNVLYLSSRLTDPDQMESIRQAREKLLAARNLRPLPIKDTKIIAAWNGLMISAFARAADTFSDNGYLKAAGDAARFILEKMTGNGRLYRSFKDSTAHIDAFSEDYAFLVQAFLDLYAASLDPGWLEQARVFDFRSRRLFEDEINGGVFTASADTPFLIAREKTGTDSAIPSSNSVSLMNWARMAAFFPDDDYRSRAQKLLRCFGRQMAGSPLAFSGMITGLDLLSASEK